MIEPLSTTVSPEGHLVVGGCDVADLANEFGTPLYILDIETIKARAREYMALSQEYPNVRIAYASKALSLTALYQVLDAEGLYFDVVSDGELFTLLNAGVDPQKAFFHGNNKTQEELAFAMKKGVGYFVLDNEQELDRLERVMSQQKTAGKVKVFIRYIPEIDAHTHEFIQTGKRDTKFGVLKEDLPRVIDRILANRQLDLRGLHAHIGSQIFDVHPFEVLIERLLDRSMDILRSHGIVLEELSIGGGVGIQYTQQDDPPAIADFVVSIACKMKSYLAQIGYPIEPELVLEPGRSLVANAGITLYSIGGIKHIPGIRTYLSVDGGMA
ncbi:MAG: diaminopimelate decarboxylase, partial [Candidatus Margulisiibacteriota bacterium]